jgi:hypothetical protein
MTRRSRSTCLPTSSATPSASSSPDGTLPLRVDDDLVLDDRGSKAAAD